MKTLVAGGAGHIGFDLVQELPGTGHEIIVMDNYMCSKQPLPNCDYKNNAGYDDVSNR